jgi:N-acetylglucosamine malate deacetylase 1
VIDFEKTILSVHAHPDDAEIFCAGTLALLSRKGYRIIIAAITNGNLGGFGMTKSVTAKVRKVEAEKAAAVIGAEFTTLDFPDGFLFDTKEARIALLVLIRKVRAGIVFTHLPNDYHADHRATANIAEIAAMLATLPNAAKNPPLAKTPLLYHCSPLRNRDNIGHPVPTPGFIVDISGVIEAKKKMIDCHVSQKEVMKRMHGMDDFTGEMLTQSKMIGSLAGAEYAEAFWQHTGGAFSEFPQVQDELKEYIREPRKG